MREVVKRFPDVLDAATLFAQSLMILTGNYGTSMAVRGSSRPKCWKRPSHGLVAEAPSSRRHSFLHSCG